MAKMNWEKYETRRRMALYGWTRTETESDPPKKKRQQQKRSKSRKKPNPQPKQVKIRVWKARESDPAANMSKRLKESEKELLSVNNAIRSHEHALKDKRQKAKTLRRRIGRLEELIAEIK